MAGFGLPTSGTGAGGAIQSTDDVGADGFFDPTYQSLRACAHAVFPLGGSRQTSLIGTSYQDAIDYIDFEVTDANYAGFTYAAEVDVLTADAGTSVTAKIRNVTDGTDAVVGAASTATSWTRQTLSFTPTVGKRYRLQLIKGNDSANAYGIGFIERTA